MQQRKVKLVPNLRAELGCRIKLEKYGWYQVVHIGADVEEKGPLADVIQPKHIGVLQDMAGVNYRQRYFVRRGSSCYLLNTHMVLYVQRKVTPPDAWAMPKRMDRFDMVHVCLHGNRDPATDRAILLDDVYCCQMKLNKKQTVCTVNATARHMIRKYKQQPVDFAQRLACFGDQGQALAATLSSLSIELVCLIAQYLFMRCDLCWRRQGCVHPLYADRLTT